MSKKGKAGDDTAGDWGHLPIIVCACGSTDWIQKPSTDVVCRNCGRPIKEGYTKDERP